MAERRIAVTGAAGFIGSHLCERLIRDGHDVVGLDNFDPFYPRAVKEENLSGLLQAPGFSFLETDVREAGVVEGAFRDRDAVVHLAARAGVRPSLKDPVGYAEVNVAGTAAVLEAARRAGVPRFLFASSSSVYGEGAEAPFREDGSLGRPASPYAATKVAGEALCRSYVGRIPNVVALRLFSVFGPRQRPDLAIHDFARRILAGEELPLFGSSDRYRDYTYVDDIVEGIVAALEIDPEWTILNLGSGRPITLGKLVAALEDVLGRRTETRMVPAATGDLFGTWADVSLASEMLGYEPRTPLETGIGRFIEWLTDHERRARSRPPGD